VVNHCTKGSLTGMTKVAKIVILRVRSSSRAGWILLGIGGWVCWCCSDCGGWLVVKTDGIRWS